MCPLYLSRFFVVFSLSSLSIFPRRIALGVPLSPLTLDTKIFPQEPSSINVHIIRAILSACPSSVPLKPPLYLSATTSNIKSSSLHPAGYTTCFTPSLPVAPLWSGGGGWGDAPLYSHLLCASLLKQLCHYLCAY